MSSRRYFLEIWLQTCHSCLPLSELADKLFPIVFKAGRMHPKIKKYLLNAQFFNGETFGYLYRTAGPFSSLNNGIVPLFGSFDDFLEDVKENPILIMQGISTWDNVKEFTGEMTMEIIMTTATGKTLTIYHWQQTNELLLKIGELNVSVIYLNGCSKTTMFLESHGIINNLRIQKNGFFFKNLEIIHQSDYDTVLSKIVIQNLVFMMAFFKLMNYKYGEHEPIHETWTQKLDDLKEDDLGDLIGLFCYLVERNRFMHTLEICD